MRSVHTLAWVHAHLGGTSLPCLAFWKGTPGSLICSCVSFTLSTFLSPFAPRGLAASNATTKTLTPALLFYRHQDMSPWFTRTCTLWTFRLQPLQAPPSSGHSSCSGRAWPVTRFSFAITGSSDFAHYSQSHQSLWAESSLYRLRPMKAQTVLRTIQSLPVALHPVSPRRSYFQLLAGSSAREGLSPSCARLLPSARVL